MEKAVLKGSRWLLLKAPENLKAHPDQKKDERVRLQAALELNQPLATAYYMKERLRLLFQSADKDRAETELTAWIREADSSKIRILKDAARKLLIWKQFILNWHNHRISTGKLEAINCKIGTLQRNAYGYLYWPIYQSNVSHYDEELSRGIVPMERTCHGTAIQIT
jgi:transposase